MRLLAVFLVFCAMSVCSASMEECSAAFNGGSGNEVIDCYTTPRDYKGILDTTKTGLSCQRWDSQTPHQHTRNNPANFPDASLHEANNYCRDPDNTGIPWCYTTDTSKRWEPCYVPNCHEINSEYDCYVKSSQYRGLQAKTSSDIACQRWDSQSPHAHTRNNPDKFPDPTLADAANYCRNPDLTDEEPWCYTTELGTRWAYCGIPACDLTQSITFEKECQTCTCSRDGNSYQMQCVSKPCPPLECHEQLVTQEEGQCCPVCLPGCYKEYVGRMEIGDTVANPDGCGECTCTEFGPACTVVMCATAHCDPAVQVMDASGCCMVCRDAACYDEESGMVELGSEMLSNDPCETCRCTNTDTGPQKTCNRFLCTMVCSGEIIDDGSCCGVCEEDPACDPTNCPKLSCKKALRFQNEDMCCPECMCKYKRGVVNPGPVGDRCEGCVCENGEVTCTPPSCPENTLQCVDPIVGEDCCYQCPNGQTCGVSKRKSLVVIKAGEVKVIKKKVCICSESFWFPNAFCAPKVVNEKKLFSGVKNYQTVIHDYNIHV